MSRSLRIVRRSPRTRAVVLVLHGGQARSDEPTTWRQLSVWRSRWLAGSLARAGRRDGVSVAFLRYAVRGWNDGAPVADARWALDELRQTWPGVPIGVVGYSMGGRVALRLVGEPDVAAMATVSAWVEAADLPLMEPTADLPVLLLHGADDQVTTPCGSLLTATRLREAGALARADVEQPDTHAMVRRARTWHRLVAEHLLAHLLPDEVTVSRPPSAPR
ncbi:dienelactone hydrolase family protein [Ornithinimicrobium sp. LYQ92]|uniref:dienelactone hydrolase family protein n=1 Tax=Serinicoccus sp. LYQ92 TaxID=3378798 RepID=UPI003854215D